MNITPNRMIKDEMLGPTTREEKGKRKKKKVKRTKKKKAVRGTFSTVVLGNAIEHPNTQISIYPKNRQSCKHGRHEAKSDGFIIITLITV